jgi:putative permease
MVNSKQPAHINLFKNAFKYFLPNEQAVSLAFFLVVCFLLIYGLSDLLMPVFVSIVFAYLLEGLVVKLELIHIPRTVAVCVVFSVFLASLCFLLLYLLPMIYEQSVELVQNLPGIISRAQTGILRLPQLYPKLISQQKIYQIMSAVQNELLTYAQSFLSLSAASVVGLVSALIYLFLVPMMVFFFLKDKQSFLAWFMQFMPKKRNLTVRVWQEVDIQIGNYVRGKFAEVFILWVTSFITFAMIGLNYAMLLSVLMGISVIIPYIGATLVTFPVLIVGYFQWGLDGDDFTLLLIAYSVIQALDAVFLIPFLFSEAVNLHPVAIIIAILFFGGLWGFWGVFFAIPLATVVKAVLTAWPRMGESLTESVQ